MIALDGRIALVTGGARVIGEAIARTLRELGTTVVVGDLAPGDGGIELDVRSAAAWEAAVAWTLGQHVEIDLVVSLP